MFCPGGEYDAYSLKGEAIIKQVASKNESQQSSLLTPMTCLVSKESLIVS